MEYNHTPVMMEEVLEFLNLKKGHNCIDCTLGGGGYTLKIAEKVGQKGNVLAIDLDLQAINYLEFQISKLKIKNIAIVKGNFADLEKIVQAHWPKEDIKFDGIVYDLGLSSAQLGDAGRGFSFNQDAPLDMAFVGAQNNTGEINYTTEVIVNQWPSRQLEIIIKKYGEEKYAKKIAENIAKERKRAAIKNTRQLIEIISKSIPKKNQISEKIHFATRTFQALRIATNDELNSLEKTLPQAVNMLKKNGRLAVVSYHSLEDRIVKHFFKKESKNCLCPPEIPVCRCDHKAKIKILTKKPIIPKQKEIKTNPRSRSAKLRAAEKII